MKGEKAAGSCTEKGKEVGAMWECFLSVVRSRAVTLCFLGMGGILTAGVLAIAGNDIALIAVLAAACVTVVLLWLIVSGLLEWKRFAELEALLEELPEKYLLGEILPKPVNDMERRYFRIMKEVSRSAIGIAEQARREKEEYCDYVESWIHEMKTPLTAATLILDGAISRGGRATHDDMISRDNRISYDDMISRNNMISHDDMISRNNMISHDDMTSRDNVFPCDREEEKPADTGAMANASDEKTNAGTWMHEREADMRKLRRELKRADNLTESILYYARLRTAEKDVKISEFSVAESIEEAVKSQMELLIGAGISVEAEGDFRVYSDKKSLCFILKQLLINCGKYCPGCQIRIRAWKGVISVWDNGPGIPAHELHRVTERGFTGSAFHIGTSGFGGTGMGLYIVKELCDQLGITMEITSKEGEFTCVALGYGSWS